MRIRKLMLTSATVGAVYLFGLLSGFALERLGWVSQDPRFGLLEEAQSYLGQYYLGELPDSLTQQRGMIHGLISKMDDPFTSYLEPVTHELEQNTLSGEFGGIGVQISQDESGALRIFPFEDSPAAQAGLQEADILIAIDDWTLTTDDSLNDISAAIRGPLGSTVRISYLRESESQDLKSVEIVRQAIPLPSVNSFLVPDQEEIGLIKITVFSEKTSDEVQQAYEALAARGAQALILDLRGNNGGLLDSGIAVTRLFLKEGLILTERGVDEREVRHEANSPGPLSDVPLVVLVDGGTASAAEILAAALQEHERAILIGQTTFGKGSVQTILELRDGSSLHVTSARWTTPSGAALDGVGLEPDLRIDNPEPDAAYHAAVDALRQLKDFAP